MPASAHLDTLLQRWAAQTQNLRKEASFQKDLIEPVALTALGNRLAMRERRRRELEQLVEKEQERRLRWDERLSRIQGWKSSVDQLSQTEQHIRSLLRASAWLKKASESQGRFSSRILAASERLRLDELAYREKLEIWRQGLETRLESIADSRCTSPAPGKSRRWSFFSRSGSLMNS